MSYELPKSVEIQGQKFPIRYDYRVVLDIFEALDMTDVTRQERDYAALFVFYPDAEEIINSNHLLDALTEMYRFINCGKLEKTEKKEPNLVSWKQDFSYICSAVNRILGTEIRAIPYDHEKNTGGLHWYTFMSAYMEIGDCFFSQIISIRNKKAKNKPLDKAEKEFYSRNKDVIDIKREYSALELETVSQWI